jgi:hypothetical protein
MPYSIRKVRNQECYTVKNIETGKIHSKCTTRKKAEGQVRLLQSIESGSYRPSKKNVKGTVKPTRKTARKTTRKTARKTARKTTRKTARKTTRKTARKTTRKPARNTT